MASERLQRGSAPTSEQTPSSTLEFYRNFLTGGGKSAPAGIAKVEKALRDAEGPPPPPEPASSGSKYVDPATGIRFADGGQVGVYPKKQNPAVKPFGSKPPAKPC